MASTSMLEKTRPSVDVRRVHSRWWIQFFSVVLCHEKSTRRVLFFASVTCFHYRSSIWTRRSYLKRPTRTKHNIPSYTYTILYLRTQALTPCDTCATYASACCHTLETMMPVLTSPELASLALPGLRWKSPAACRKPTTNKSPTRRRRRFCSRLVKLVNSLPISNYSRWIGVKHGEL